MGQISVSGMTICNPKKLEEPSLEYIVQFLLGTASECLSRIRTIKVTLTVHTGNYSISSLATVYNALFLGGGPESMVVIEILSY
jgi:hypothetical protein